MTRFDEFENEKSVSMISVLVALGSLLLGPLFAGIVILIFVSVASDPSNFAVFSVFGLAWASTVPFLIWYASKAIRRTDNPHLGTKAFLVFQLTAGAIVLLARFLPPTSSDLSNSSAVVDGLRYLFGVILLVATMTFIILAKVIRSKLSASTYLGLVFDLVVLLSPVMK